MVTGRPSNSIWPESMGWMPAMHLMRVDFPAPLSPTRAITSPRRTVKSTSCSTWTAPKLLLSPVRRRTGSPFSATWFLLPGSGRARGGPLSVPGFRVPGAPSAVRGPPRGRRGRLLDARVLALLRVGALAEVLGLDEAVVHDLLDVVLVDADRGQQHGRDVALALGVVGGPVGLGLLALDQGHGELGGGVGLLLDRLVDRHALGAVEDVLQALDGRVL